MNKVIISLVSCMVFSNAGSQLPEFYNEVTSVDWVVSDLESVVSSWSQLGFGPVKIYGELSLTGIKYRGHDETFHANVAVGYLCGFKIIWIQPLEGNSDYSDYLANHGDGVFSLNHRVSSQEKITREVDRVAGIGVKVLQTGEFRLGENQRIFTHLDTEPEGKYVLGLVYESEPDHVDPSLSLPFSLGRSQYAFVVKELEPPSQFWARFGMPAMEVTRPELGDLRYRGEPGVFDQRLGWQRHGTVTYEWIEPLKGPTVYVDALEVHGEGFHHFAFDVEDIDQAVAYFESHQILCSQSGSWGEMGKPGSGRFAYVDTAPLGGVTIELLWNFK